MQSSEGTGTDPGCIQLSSILGEMGWFNHFHLENTAHASEQSMQLGTVAAKQTVPVHPTKRSYKKRNAAAIAIVAVAVTAILTQIVLTGSQTDATNSPVTDTGDHERDVASIDDMQQKPESCRQYTCHACRYISTPETRADAGFWSRELMTHTASGFSPCWLLKNWRPTSRIFTFRRDRYFEASTQCFRSYRRSSTKMIHRSGSWAHSSQACRRPVYMYAQRH